jgi:hypothetical protein
MSNESASQDRLVADAKRTRYARAIIVTESTARRLWPGQDPLGTILRESSGREDAVIGVAKDAQVAHLGELNTSYLYFPAGPEDDSGSYVLVAMRPALAMWQKAFAMQQSRSTEMSRST